MLKQSGSARFVCVSRISPIKNQSFAAKMLDGLSGQFSLDLFGPHEETAPALPFIHYRGTLPHSDVHLTLADYDFFVLPTKGENFGHAIHEALSVGLPVIISDRTPWNDITKEMAGFVISLEDEAGWRKTLQWCIDCDLSTYRKMAANAYRFARNYVNNQTILRDNIALFNNSIANSR